MSAFADEPSHNERSDPVIDGQFALGIAFGLSRFDTNLKITDRDNGNSIFLDGESSFGLPETKIMPILYGVARINQRHSIIFHTFRLYRDGNALAVNQDFGRLNVNGRVTFSDRTNFSYLVWGYRLFDDGRTVIESSVGVYLLDLEYEVSARGEITIEDVPVQSGEYVDTVNLFAPLPLIGLDYWSRVTDKWYLGAKLGFIFGSYDDTSALVVDAAIRARYRMTNRVSMITGVNFLSADVEISKSETIRDIGYGYEGLYLGLDYNF